MLKKKVAITAYLKVMSADVRKNLESVNAYLKMVAAKCEQDNGFIQYKFQYGGGCKCAMKRCQLKVLMKMAEVKFS